MPVLTNIGLLVTCGSEGGQSEIHPIPSAALAWEGPTLTWVGPESDLPLTFREECFIDARGAMVMPGLVDCHTHLAFGGWRREEFTQRAFGMSYLDISRAGGGIRSTVLATRKASVEELVEKAEGHLKEMVRLGVTSVESKSGYGLDVENELKLLKVYRELKRLNSVRLIPTLLGAHILPDEFTDRPAAYVDLICNEMIPRAVEEELAVFCDVFLEEGAFNLSDCRRILRTGKQCGLGLKIHADQLTDGRGAELAGEVEAVSADHLEHVSPAGIKALKASDVVAVALPLASLYLKQSPLKARKLIDQGVKVAVSTDFNPGSAPSYHLPFAMSMSCVLCGLTPAEALKGATFYAAKAVGLEGQVGSLEVGKAADFAVIEAPSPDHWLYHFRANLCSQTYIGGKRVWKAEEACSEVEPC